MTKTNKMRMSIVIDDDAERTSVTMNRCIEVLRDKSIGSPIHSVDVIFEGSNIEELMSFAKSVKDLGSRLRIVKRNPGDSYEYCLQRLRGL